MKLKFTHNLFSLILFVLFISWNSIAQISTNGNLNNTIGGENPFMDMSDFSSFANNEGKGLYFPRTDLTIWTFNTGILDGITFSTAYDGMVVYNVGTGQTLAGQGIQTSVSPGYYYFYNPVALGFPDISAGEWLPVGDGGAQKINDLSDAKSDNDGTEDGSSIFFGIGAGANDDGTDNQSVGIGFNALNTNTTGNLNVALGYKALEFGSGEGSTAIGAYAMPKNRGIHNTAVGGGALFKIGTFAGFPSNNNLAIGVNSLGSSTFSNNDVAIGHFAAYGALQSSNNVVIGSFALLGNTEPNGNIAIGHESLRNATFNGNFNTAVGTQAGKNLTTGSNNILLGYIVDVPDLAGDNQLTIGNLIYGIGVDGTETTISTGNIGIGVKVPNAKLDITATNQVTPTNTDGILIPRIDNFPATDPTGAQDAMMVYLTTTQGANDPGFYYWNNSTTTWLAVGDGGAQKIDDLSDAKSDNDGTEDGSSIFFGIGAGTNDDNTNNMNVGIGFNALGSSDSSYSNVAIGWNTLSSLAGGAGFTNTAIGTGAMTNLLASNKNTAVGAGALFNAGTIGFPSENNTVLGTQALFSATRSSDNIAIGLFSLYSATIMFNNVAIGNNSLYNMTTGSSNLSLGNETGKNLTTGSHNILLGTGIDIPTPTDDNQLNIGNILYGIGVDGVDNTISTGSIGIGIKAPTEKLEVAGNIYASGGGVLLTDTGVYADYVFENYTEGSSAINKEYTFKTLEEVEVFVRANKHLPGVTGIKELKKTATGYVVNITALSGQLLEKVEELFLHAIAQQKTITVLQEKIAVMETERQQLNTKDIDFSTLPTYANDTAATQAGLDIGDLYKTSTGALQIKL